MPFGEEIPADGTVRSATYGYQSGWDGFATKFTGQLRDNETGLDYFHARYYSAAQGRFTSADAPLMFATPDDPQGWNLYSYTRNNPLNRIDPDGHQDFILDFGMMDQKARAVELQITTSPSRSSFWGGVLKGFVGGALEGFKSNVHGALG
jgi:RHS repeat-associated protein